MATEQPNPGDVQRLFLQAVLSRRVLSGDLAKVLWRKSIDAVKAANTELDIEYSERSDAWDDFVKNINESVNSLDLEFRHTQDETSGRSMYALVNRRGDDVAQMATEYSPGEIAYFKAIVEQIMLAPRESFSVSSLLALRELSAIKSNMTKIQGENALVSFVAKGWLYKSKRGRYSLSPRTLLELQSYLRATYPDEILDCTICMEMVTRGVACYTRQCKTRMHNHCLKAFVKRNNTCPACQVTWDEAGRAKLCPVGEGAVKDGQDEHRRTREVDDDEEEEEAEVDYEAEEPSQSQPSQSEPSRTSQRKGKARQVDDDDDAMEEDVKPSQTQRRRKSQRG